MQQVLVSFFVALVFSQGAFAVGGRCRVVFAGGPVFEKLEALGYSPGVGARIAARDRLSKSILENPKGGRAVVVYRGLNIPPEKIQMREKVRRGSLGKAIWVSLKMQVSLRYANRPELAPLTTLLEIEMPEFFFHSSYSNNSKMSVAQLRARSMPEGYVYSSSMPELGVFIRRVGVVTTDAQKPVVEWFSYEEALSLGLLRETPDPSPFFRRG